MGFLFYGLVVFTAFVLLRRYGIFDILRLTKHTSFEVGQQFEDFLEHVIFQQPDFLTLEKTHSYDTNKVRYVYSSLKPDFKFLNTKSKSKFYIEAKYHSRDAELMQWCTENQLHRYRNYDKPYNPVYLALGVGGTPKSPQDLYLIPLHRIKNNKINLNYYQDYLLPVDNFSSVLLYL